MRQAGKALKTLFMTPLNSVCYEWHNQILVVAEWCIEGCFSFICFSDSDKLLG